MCRSDTEDELKHDFVRRTREREFPTCPPLPRDGDGRLTFFDPVAQKRRFHHGGQFALTRWTNLYFPVAQMLWGDAIGGPVGPIFGANVEDMPISTDAAKRFLCTRPLLRHKFWFRCTSRHCLTEGDRSGRQI
jgi:hypothetical protein